MRQPDDLDDMPPYEHLGNLSAVEPVHSVHLTCWDCKVQWVGCWDQNQCPRCGGTEDWERRQKIMTAPTSDASGSRAGGEA